MADSYKSVAALGCAVAKHLETRAVQQLVGIVQGVLADGQLHDNEIRLLRTWATVNRAACQSWPGSAVAAMVEQVCADGVIDEGERVLLLQNLSKLVGSDFAETGSVSAEPTSLPVDDSAKVEFVGAHVVHTGTFLFGTRARCERATATLGGIPVSSVSRKVKVVVIGGMVTHSWATEAFGRKIMAAAALREAGHPVVIISEAHWMRHLPVGADRDDDDEDEAC